MSELKPCPFCGCNELIVQEQAESLAHPSNHFPEHVECSKCRIHITGGRAKDRWNTRAAEQENQALKAMVKMLRDGISRFNSIQLAGSMSMYGVIISDYYRLKELIEKTPQQSLDTHDAEIEEEVIERCASEVFAYTEVIEEREWSNDNIVQLIENIPRKYQSSTNEIDSTEDK